MKNLLGLINLYIYMYIYSPCTCVSGKSYDTILKNELFKIKTLDLRGGAEGGGRQGGSGGGLNGQGEKGTSK